MAEPVTINRDNALDAAQDFNFLRKEGIKYIEGLAGKVWTDYNTHDPGITLLEAICYALTDLGYRTAFNIEDIMAPAARSMAAKWGKIFYTAREVLPCNPLTITDYRKLVIDTEGVRNAWIEISDEYELPMYLQQQQQEDKVNYALTYDYKKGDDIIRLRGLYKVFVEYEEETGKAGREADVAKVIWEKLHFHRNLTEDFITVSPVEYEAFPIEAIIQVSEGSDAEMINAKIYKVVHDFFSPAINFYSLEEMLQKGISPEEIFEGPVLNYGFIDPEELIKTERFKNIHLSDIINIVSGIEGVIAIKKFVFQVNAQLPFSNFTEWINSVKDKQKTPRLDIQNSSITFERSGDRNRNDNRQVNKERVSAMYSFMEQDNFRNRLKGAGKDIAVPQGEFMDIAAYYPFQKDLPAVYGMEETFIKNNHIDESCIATALQEIIAEKAGLNAATLITILLTVDKHRQQIETLAEELITTNGVNTIIVKTIIDHVWADNENDSAIKKTLRQLLPNAGNLHEKKALYNYVEHAPQPIAPSEKSITLNHLAQTYLHKSLVKIKTEGDVDKLGSLYTKYLLGQLDKRKKLALQLRGFLMVMEQMMADYLSQLSHAREIFSFDEKVTQVFYPQLVDEVNDMETLFIDFEHFKKLQLQMLETQGAFTDKRNNMLDHLMARFGESMDKYGFFMRQFEGKDAAPRLVEDKAALLSDYVQISGYRNKGYNYTDGQQNWNSNNVEGLKKRICRLLGIHNYNREKIAPTSLRIEKIKLDNDVERYVIKLSGLEDERHALLKSNEFEFENEAINTLTYLLEQAADRTLYKEEGNGDKWHFVITRITEENIPETVAHSRHYKTAKERDNALETVLGMFRSFTEAENFHMLEHILLRPKIGARQTGGGKEEVLLLPAENVPDKVQQKNTLVQDSPYQFKIIQTKDLQLNKGFWTLSLMKNGTELLKVNENFIFYKHLTRRMVHIQQAGSSAANYTTGQTVDGYNTFKIFSGTTLLAESNKNYKNAADAEQEVAALISYFSYGGQGINSIGGDDSPALYADPYSLQLSIIFPSWQRRFRNPTFRHLLEKTVYLETPSHIYAHVYWADHNQMREFDEAYEVWTKEMAVSEIPATDIVNNLITVLNKLKS